MIEGHLKIDFCDKQSLLDPKNTQKVFFQILLIFGLCMGFLLWIYGKNRLIFVFGLKSLINLFFFLRDFKPKILGLKSLRKKNKFIRDFKPKTKISLFLPYIHSKKPIQRPKMSKIWKKTFWVFFGSNRLCLSQKSIFKCPSIKIA